MKCPNGSETVLSPGPWKQLIKVRGAICEDGKPRTATVTGEADTYFSIPARVKAGGKTVSGFLTSDENGYRFIAYQYRKNHHVIKRA